jgi:biotin operon repressor
MSRLHPIVAVLLAAALAAPAIAAEEDWQSQVAQALGKSGTASPDGTYRVGMPRTDLKVTLDGVQLKPGFALGSWAAFKPMGNDAMVMGDLVLTQDEVNPAMKKLEQGGIEITAVHNHLLRAEPMTLYMHILGHGDPVKLAEAIHAGLALSKTPLQVAQAGTSQAPAEAATAFNAEAVEKALGRKGKDNGGVYSFSIPRAEPVKEDGMELSDAQGAATAINFQPTGDRTAAITGDFVMIDKEVNPVIKALQENGIEITALHSHMLDEQPRVFFMHFWANDDAEKLAKGLRAALDKMAVKKS